MKPTYHDALATYRRLCHRAAVQYRSGKPALLGFVEVMSTNSSFHESCLRLATLWELSDADRQDVMLVLLYLALNPPVPREFNEAFSVVEI